MCLHEETETYDVSVEEGRVVEFAIKCVSCGKHINRWSYGSWMDEEE